MEKVIFTNHCHGFNLQGNLDNKKNFFSIRRTRLLTTKNYSLETKQNFPSQSSFREPQFAVGNSSFEAIHRESCIYIDKTKAIKKLIDSKEIHNVTLLLRPRRFGKSLFQSMLYSYFNCSFPKKSQIKLFSEYEIWNIQNGKYRKYCGQYPVVRICLKDTTSDSFDTFLKRLYCILKELQRDIQKKYGVLVNAPLVDFLFLTIQALSKKYGPVILLVDEIDSPFRYAMKNGYYDKLAPFMEKFLWRTLRRENTCLDSAILTGIPLFPFPNMHNIKVCTVLNKDFSDAIGFTLEETKNIFSHYAHSTAMLKKLIKENGYYYIGGKKIFDAWSVINTVSDLVWMNSRGLSNSISQTNPTLEHRSKYFWIKSGNLGNLITQINPLGKWRLKKLLQSKTPISVNKKINPLDMLAVLTSHSLIKNQQALWLSLLFIGYLTDISDEHSTKTKLIIPNEDIHYELAEELNRSQKEKFIVTPFHFFKSLQETKQENKPAVKTRKETYELGNRYMSNRYT